MISFFAEIDAGVEDFEVALQVRFAADGLEYVFKIVIGERHQSCTNRETDKTDVSGPHRAQFHGHAAGIKGVEGDVLLFQMSADVFVEAAPICHVHKAKASLSQEMEVCIGLILVQRVKDIGSPFPDNRALVPAYFYVGNDRASPLAHTVSLNTGDLQAQL